MKSNYEYNKKWRNAHRDEYYRMKARYYAETAFAENGGQPYTKAQDDAILAHDRTDRELAAEFGRSVTAIQHRRYRLKK